MTEHVELGEMTVQFTAPNGAAKEEIEQFRKTVQSELRKMDDANAVLEEFTLEEFDPRLSWGDDGA